MTAMDLDLIAVRAAFLERRLQDGEIPITTVARLADDVLALIARVRELEAEHAQLRRDIDARWPGSARP